MARARLLIVGDDPKLRPFLRIELEIESYICAEAASGQQALALIRAERWWIAATPGLPPSAVGQPALRETLSQAMGLFIARP